MPLFPAPARCAFFGVLLALVAGGGCAQPKPGQRWVDDMELRGARLLDADKVLDGLETRETGWWPCADKQWFDPAVLELDIQRIEAYAAAHGLFEARVVKKELRRHPEDPILDVCLTLREGQPTEVTEVTVKGLEALAPAVRRTVELDLPVAVGQRFDHGRYSRTKELLKGRLQRQGYAYAEVEGTVRVHRKKRFARISLRARPGPRVRLGKTRVQGNGEVPADKLRNLVAWKPGQFYHPDLLTKTRARLFNLRVFATVRLELPKKPTEVAEVAMIVSVAPLKELRLGLGVGFERKWHEVRLTANWTWRNFLGGLRTLEVSLTPAFVSVATFWDADRIGPAVTGEVKLTQPDIFGTGIAAYGLGGYALEMHEGYRFHGPKAQLGLGRSFIDDYLRLDISWNLHFYDFFDIVDASAGSSSFTRVLEFADPYRLAWLEQAGILDLRDAAMDPRAGFYAEVRVEEGLGAVGGEFDYIKVMPDLRGYIPLGTKRLVLALRALLGWMDTVRDPDQIGTPITRRFKLGGPTSHRGFSYGRLSPQAFTCASSDTSGTCVEYDTSGIPEGGDGALLFSADLRLRVYRLFGGWLSVSGFFDAGDVTPHFSDLSFARLHLATGGSLQYETPIGHVRFAVGVRLNRMAQTAPDRLANPDPGSDAIDRVAFHLTLGEAF